MRKYFGSVAGFWLGFSISYFCGYGFLNWQWWAIVVPTITLFAFNKKEYE